MAQTLRCPKCSTKTKKYWFANKTRVLNVHGEVALHPGGAVAWGYPTRRCPRGDWVGDWSVIALPPASKPGQVVYDDDDEDDDYIAHYYH